jgi:hypothetical protein
VTIAEIQAAAKTLAQTITAAVQAFETSTGCIVHSVPIRRPESGPPVPATADVKIQIPTE